ncbi:MAG: DUF6675 family protein [Syntrophobacter sp.]
MFAANKLKTIFSVLAVAVVMATVGLVPASAAESPFPFLSEAETTKIKKGEMVFRQPTSWNNLSVPSEAANRASIIQKMKQKRPNYIGEVLMKIPVAANPDLVGRLEKYLTAPQNMVGIRYWSKRNKEYYDLFDEAREISKGSAHGGTWSEVSLHMEPFSGYTSRNEWTSDSRSLSYSSRNLTSLSYKGVTAVNSGDLEWRIELVKAENYWILYGLGTVKAFDMLGLLRERLTDSFIGRIEAYFTAAFNAVTVP